MLYEVITVKVMDASRLKRMMYNWALPVGYEYADAVFCKRKPSAFVITSYSIHYTKLYDVSFFLGGFALVFGSRYQDFTKRQGGLLTAVALESIVKLMT